MDRSTILTVDDTNTNLEILIDILSDEYDVMAAMDGESALEIANEDNPDLILLDIKMPRMDGYEVCRRLKQNHKTKNIPVVFITADTSEDSLERAYDLGGRDYVTKPFRVKELLARVKNQIDLKKMIDHFEYISSYDQLTGVYNRRKFFELGEVKFQEKNEDLYAVMIDIDKFKDINDTHGHDVGDKVIRLMAQTINNMVDNNSIFGRLGGEEFAVLCNIKEKCVVVKNLESIRKKIEALELITDEGESVKFTISSGVSNYSDEFETIDALLKDADKALYEAKGSGRNKSIFRD